jgi:ferritin-like metal-binding protein YciE
MHNIVSLRDLLLTQMGDLYHAERQFLKSLPLFRELATLSELKVVIDCQKKETGGHIQRLDTIFSRVHMQIHDEENCVMQCLVSQAVFRADRCVNDAVRDAMLITAIQQINHYHVTAYGAACAFANELNAPEIAALLHETLEEEKDMDRQLSELARQKVNILANRVKLKAAMPKRTFMGFLTAY